MKVTMDQLLLDKERLCQSLGKQKPSLKVLARHSKAFQHLQSICPGLKLNLAMGAFAEKRFCACCGKNLAKYQVCPPCLLTEEGRALAAKLKGRASSRAWKSKSEEDIVEISAKKKSTNLRRCGADHHMKTLEGKLAVERGCLRNLGVQNPSYDKACKEKRVQTSLKNWGTRTPLESPQVRQLVKDALLKKHGVENVSQIPEVKAKVKRAFQAFAGGHPQRDPAVRARTRQTNLDRTGYENPGQSPEAKLKAKRTSLVKYGVPNPSQSPEVKAKLVVTNQRLYGYDHPMQNPQVFKERMKRLHRTAVVRLQGREFRLQGYEPQAARAMLSKLKGAKLKDAEDSFTYTIGRKTKTYYPDFEIRCPEDTYVVEVKSLYTLQAGWEMNLAKFKAAKTLLSEKTFVLVIYEPRLRRAVGIKNPTVQRIESAVSRMKADLDAL